MAIINRLRFVDIMSPGLGEQASRDFADALQDEMQDVVLSPEQELLLARLMAEMRGEVEQLRSQMWQIAAAVVGFNFTMLSLATALIVALN